MTYFYRRINYTERDLEIYHKREVEGRTLKSIGDEYGLSIERIRGIAARIYRMKSAEKEMGLRWSNPKTMADICWSNVRIPNCFYNENAMDLPIEEFIKNFNYHRLMRISNFGKKSIKEICEKLEEYGYKDIEHLRSYKAASRREYEKAASLEAVKKVMTS